MRNIAGISAVFKAMVVGGALSVGASQALAEGADVDPKKIQQEAKKNTQFVLGSVLKKAKSLQDTYGDFAPFGAGLFPNGEVKYVWLAKPGETVNDPAKAIPLVRTVLEAQAAAGALLASAVVYKYGSLENPQINVELEYRSGFAEIVGTKFTLDKDGKVFFGDAGRQPFVNQVFKQVAAQ